MDPYVVLGVDRVAGPDEIEAAYARRSRLHDPAAQSTEAERTAAERYHAELADAYRVLLGTTPPRPAERPASAAESGTGAAPTAVRATKGDTRSPGRDLLVVLGTLVAAYLVIQLSVTVAPGFDGLLFGVVAAVALVAGVLVRERSRRT